MKRRQQSLADRERDARDVRRHLRSLTETVLRVLNDVDRVMRQPDSGERGRALSRLMNELEYANDSAMHFGLGVRLSRLTAEAKTSQDKTFRKN